MRTRYFYRLKRCAQPHIVQRWLFCSLECLNGVHQLPREHVAEHRVSDSTDAVSRLHGVPSFWRRINLHERGGLFRRKLQRVHGARAAQLSGW